MLGCDERLSGNMTALVTPSEVEHDFLYDLLNQNTGYVTPLSGSYSYEYDGDRRLVAINFPSGRRIENVYNQGRLVRTVTPEGNIDFAYTASGLLQSVTRGGESVAYTYDGSLVMSDVRTGAMPSTLAYTYNTNFDMETITYAGSNLYFGYDADRLLTRAFFGFYITRDPANGLPTLVTGSSSSIYRLAPTYNGYGEVAGQSLSVWNKPILTWNLTRDVAGRIIGKSETVNTVPAQQNNYAYGYDNMGRLTSVTKNGALVEQYTYGANGERLTETNTLRGITGKTYAYDTEDHILQAGDTEYVYDVDGFLTAKYEHAGLPNQAVTQYEYSSRGELLRVILPDNRTVEYVNDPMGRRVAKKINGVVVEKYLWGGMADLLAVYEGNGALRYRFEGAKMATPSGNYYLATDQIGKVRR